jgi:SSS family solute:Na+ symporter
LLTALGFYMWPHTFGSVFTAENARVIRRNATYLPLYQLILLFVFFVGFAAVLRIPGLSARRWTLPSCRSPRRRSAPL